MRVSKLIGINSAKYPRAVTAPVPPEAEAPGPPNFLTGGSVRACLVGATRWP